MRYKIVEYASGIVHVLRQDDEHDTFGLIKVFDGPHAWERAQDHVRTKLPDDTVMRGEIIDV